MIHTNELMLGNWVEYATGLNNDKRSIPMYVTAIFDDEVYLDFPGNEGDPWEIRDEDLCGIPITEELLTSLFGDGTDRIWKAGNTIIHRRNEDIEIVLFGQLIDGIKFLHELQNAYLMLTRKQLEVKL